MRLVAALAASLIAGCATLPAGVAPSECRERFEQLDARIAEAGMRDGGEHRVAGFPYLRVNRFLASFRDEVKDEKRFAAWVEHLRQLDLKARLAELHNLNADAEVAALDRCGGELAQRELKTSSARNALRNAAHMPDDYSIVARFIGLYPLATPFLRLGIDGYQKEIRKNYQKPLAEMLALQRMEYHPRTASAVPLRVSSDALNIPRLTDVQWQALAQAHAPVFSVETRGGSDYIGAPKWVQGRIKLNARQPVVYFQPAFTRFGDKVLPQLVYTAWFAERPARGAFDSYSGTLDGIVWRVTLDEHNRPLAYDTIHACGCYHHWFPVQPLKQRGDTAKMGDPPLLPQNSLAPLKPVLLVDGETHFVSRVFSPSPPKPQKGRTRISYALQPYADLLSVDAGDVDADDYRTRSLFGEDGIVNGTERSERFWLWMSGINSPGAMRQWGRHATAFIGRRHFDDARVLEEVFIP